MLEHYPEDWRQRTKLAAALIKPFASVLEFGAGKQWLKEYLPTGCQYHPYEIEDFNLNDEVYPVLPEHDTTFIMGVLEYLDSIPEVISRLTSRYVIISYAITSIFDSFDAHMITKMAIDRDKNGWKNHFSESQLIHLFAKNGYTAKTSVGWKDQVIYLFEFER